MPSMKEFSPARDVVRKLITRSVINVHVIIHSLYLKNALQFQRDLDIYENASFGALLQRFSTGGPLVASLRSASQLY
jgi:hypothetical protein